MNVGCRALLALSLALALAAGGAAQACGGHGGSSEQGGSSGGHRHHHGGYSEPDSWMYQEGRTYDSNGRPFYHPDPSRDRYLNDMRRYHSLPWYKQMWEGRPRRDDSGFAGIRG